MSPAWELRVPGGKRLAADRAGQRNATQHTRTLSPVGRAAGDGRSADAGERWERTSVGSFRGMTSGEGEREESCSCGGIDGCGRGGRLLLACVGAWRTRRAGGVSTSSDAHSWRAAWTVW